MKNTIFESDLVRLAKYIQRVDIVQTPEGKFRTFVILQGEEDEKLLVTHRKIPKEWASMDRMVAHINSMYEDTPDWVVPSIVLILQAKQKGKT